ncbi:MAG: hypothetical protein A2Y48_05360 [Nitrospirae bacterium RIFCSPLOW2_12_42_9]|nr:MAG: hypothetical protein A2Y48_05360 [Nitrospirae bacterium RIFCSPLOW2_12_42_9]HBI22836.1 transcriptional regulator [Nitrospiraceae bacterium]
MTTQNDIDSQICRLHAEICQTMANPKRLQIINILREKEISAGELQRILKIPKANLSQHMAVLKQKGIVVARREGNTVYFRLARPKILKAYDIMREVLFEVIENQQKLLTEARKKNRRS